MISGTDVRQEYLALNLFYIDQYKKTPDQFIDLSEKKIAYVTYLITNGFFWKPVEENGEILYYIKIKTQNTNQNS